MLANAPHILVRLIAFFGNRNPKGGIEHIVRGAFGLQVTLVILVGYGQHRLKIGKRIPVKAAVIVPYRIFNQLLGGGGGNAFKVVFGNGYLAAFCNAGNGNGKGVGTLAPFVFGRLIAPGAVIKAKFIVKILGRYRFGFTVFQRYGKLRLERFKKYS